MKKRTVFVNDRELLIELVHFPSDPGTWIVRRWKKFPWFRKRISSNWFIDGPQALEFAQQMKRQHSGS